MKTLLNYASNIYSQNGEDGVIAEILKRLDISSGQFVEFGAWDGKHLSNTFSLCQKKWHGVYIECDPSRFEDLKKTQKEFPNQLEIINAMVTISGEQSLDVLLSKTSIKQNFEILSIDIDSYDYAIWESLKNYSPTLIIIEVNSAIPLGVEYVHGTSSVLGNSFSSLVKLGDLKGYVPVCHTGNLFFIKKELIHKLGLPEEEIKNPDSLFLNSWVKEKNTY